MAAEEDAGAVAAAAGGVPDDEAGGLPEDMLRAREENQQRTRQLSQREEELRRKEEEDAKMQEELELLKRQLDDTVEVQGELDSEVSAARAQYEQTEEELRFAVTAGNPADEGGVEAGGGGGGGDDAGAPVVRQPQDDKEQHQPKDGNARGVCSTSGGDGDGSDGAEQRACSVCAVM